MNPAGPPEGGSPLVTPLFRYGIFRHRKCPDNSATTCFAKTEISNDAHAMIGIQRFQVLREKMRQQNFVFMRENILVCDVFHRAWCKSHSTPKSYVKE